MPAPLAQTTLAFSLHTTPDVAGGRALFNLDGLDDADTARAMQQLRIQQSGQERLLPHLQKISTLAVAGTVNGRFLVQTLDTSQGEASLIADFFRRLSDSGTRMLTYCGNEALYILRCRALVHRVLISRNEVADLAHFMGSDGEAPPLDELLQLQALPSIPLQFEPQTVCAIKALQTYLLYLRQQYIEEAMPEQMIQIQEAEIREYLDAQTAPHWQALLQSWPAQ